MSEIVTQRRKRRPSPYPHDQAAWDCPRCKPQNGLYCGEHYLCGRCVRNEFGVYARHHRKVFGVDKKQRSPKVAIAWSEDGAIEIALVA